MSIDLIIFDCDGVLVDTEVIGNRVYAAILTELGFPHTPEECTAKYMGMSDASVMAHFRAAGTPLPETFAHDAHAREQLALSKDLEPVPGVTDALKDLDTPYCLASSGTREKVDTSLTRTGLDHFFPRKQRFCFQQVANGKPAPDLFLLAAEQMGVAPDRSLVIEDSRAGVQAGVAAGMTTVGFTGGSHIPPGYDQALLDLGAHHILQHMDELALLLNSLSDPANKPA